MSDVVGLEMRKLEGSRSKKEDLSIFNQIYIAKLYCKNISERERKRGDFTRIRK